MLKAINLQFQKAQYSQKRMNKKKISASIIQSSDSKATKTKDLTPTSEE